MAFGINKSRLSPIAIDFGADSLKVLQVSMTGDTVQLVAAGGAVIPEKARSDTASRYAFLGGALKDILRQQPFKGRRAMCGIPAFQTLVSALELQCGQSDIDGQVDLHIQTVLEMDPSRMVVRNLQVGQVMREGSNRQRVISLAAPRSTVMRYIELATAAKLEVVGMHSEPMCLARPFIEFYSRREEDQCTRCFVDIGAETTKVVIVADGKVQMARTLRAAGDQLIRRHAREHKIDFTEARLARIREASAPQAARPFPTHEECEQKDQVHKALTTSPSAWDDLSLDLDSDQKTPAQDALIEDRRDGSVVGDAVALEDIDETLDSLVDGLRMSIRYHESVSPDFRVDRVILLGGESQQRSVREAVAYALGLPTFVGDPFARMMRTPGVQPLGVDVSQPQPGWSTPLGLCLSEANL